MNANIVVINQRYYVITYCFNEALLQELLYSLNHV